MNGYRCQGTITVFLSLVSVLFLSLVCTLLESARVQGARAWAAAVTDMGIFSVFGEYEAEILEKYDVLFLDGSYGSGDFEPERLALRMRDFMKYNTGSGTDQGLAGGMDLFPMTAESCQITGHTLATDEDGAAFYQQVVKSIRENLGMELLLKYQESMQTAEEQKKAAEAYEKKDEDAWENLKELEEQRKQEEGKEEEVQTEAADPPEAGIENPLETIRKIKKMGVLGLVVKDSLKISEKEVALSELPSGREKNHGNLPVKKESGGITADGIFQEYLLEHFGSWENPEEKADLSYQAEYILTGKSSDRENLKEVVKRLLLMREGVNFLCILSDAGMKGQVSALAAGIAGAAPVPGLTAALEAVLMLAWAYGESLLDVRTLMSGGRVPAVKEASSWKLKLENLSRVTELLESCDKGGGSGQSYADYLRILMLSGEKKRYPLRALDMIESSFASGKIRADAWVVRAETKVFWHFSPIFLKIPERFLSAAGQEERYAVTGSFGY